MNSLNGWQRLFVVIAIPWLLIGGGVLFSELASRPDSTDAAMSAFVWLTIVPLGVIYAFGWGMGWVYRGFKSGGKALIITAILCALSACGGGSSPTTPSPTPTPNPQPSTWSISGRVTTTLSGEPVAGATLDFFNVGPVTANAAGEWHLERPTPITTRTFVEVTAPGYITRRVYVDGSNSSRSGIAIDMIRDGGQFSLGFYRQFARNDFDQPGALQWLRRWTKAPNFYVQAVNPRTGVPLEESEVRLIEDTIRAVVPQMTGGTFAAGIISVGLETRTLVEGTINLEFNYDTTATYCGLSYVGENPGRITINYDRCASACGSLKVTPETIAHEIGHALGFWHVSNGGVLDSNRSRRCGNVTFSDAELYHARIAYSRPVGNADLDWDQPTSALARFAGQSAPVVQCYR